MATMDGASSDRRSAGRNEERALDAIPAALQGMLEETLLPSRNSVDLRRHPQEDFLYRLVARQPHVAELFQENTKLTPHSSANIPLPQETVEAIRTWHVETAYRPKPENIDWEEARRLRTVVPLGDLGGIGEMLAGLGQDEETGRRVYALDLWALTGDELFRFMPSSPHLWLEKRLRGDDRRLLETSLPDVGPTTLGAADVVLFVAAVAWRYMLLQGPRGYRRCLLDAGAFLQTCAGWARAGGIGVSTTLDFIDARVDRLLGLDGVERSTLAIVLLKEE